MPPLFVPLPCTSNNPPARLFTTAPFDKVQLLFPLRTTVPVLFSVVSLRKVSLLLPLIVSRPTFWNVFPTVPVTVPDDQVMLPRVLSICRPSNVCVLLRIVAWAPVPSTIEPIPERVPAVQSNVPCTANSPAPASVPPVIVNEL